MSTNTLLYSIKENMSLFDTNEEICDKINNKYEKIKLLNTGSYGKAYLCQNVATNQQCVIKQISLCQLNESDLQKQYKEVSILRSLSHPHIVKYQDSFLFKKNFLCIVMDYAEGGDLEQRISQTQKNNSCFDNKTILKWFTQLCSAVRFIHNQKIIHRDIKNNNIFLDSKDNVLLGDFGISKKLSNLKDKANTFIGTPYFMAPEQCNQQPYTNKVDIWALGVVLYRLVYLKYPFEGFEIFHLMLAISRGVISFPQNPQSPFKNIIIKLLQNDPNKRPSIDQIFEFEEIRTYLEKSRLEKQNKNKCRLNSGRVARIIKDNNSGQLELEINHPSSPHQRNLQKHEQKLFDFALQNYNNVKKVIQPPLSRNQSRDQSPGMTPKLPCLKQNAYQNLGSQQKQYPNFKSSPNLQKISKGLKLNIENDRNYQNCINIQQSPKRLNKQFSDCSTSESNKEVTPKVFQFNNKCEAESPVIGVKKVLRNNLISKYSDGQVSSSSNGNPFSSQSTQARVKFSAKKYNNALRYSDQIGLNIPPFSPAAQPIQDITTPQSAPAHQAPPIQQQQQQLTPAIKNYKNSRGNKLSRPSLHIQQQNSNNLSNQKQQNREVFQSQPYIDALKKQMKRPMKDYFINQQPAQLIPLIFKQQPQKLNEPETFNQALQNFNEEQVIDSNLDEQMTCSLNTVISQDFFKNSSKLQENCSLLKNSNILNNNNSNLNNGSNLFNNNSSSSNNNIQSNMSCSISNNISNTTNNNQNPTNNSNLFFKNNNPHSQDSNQQVQEQDILDNSINERCLSFEEKEDSTHSQNQNNFFNNADLVLSYNYTRSTLSNINSIIHSNQLNEGEELINPEQIIENRKNELIELLSEEVYLKVSHYATRLIQHYDVNKIINENLMKKQFVAIYTTESKKQINFNIDPVIFNLLQIINYEENFQQIN